jgi:hypothetical protein
MIRLGEDEVATSLALHLSSDSVTLTGAATVCVTAHAHLTVTRWLYHLKAVFRVKADKHKYTLVLAKVRQNGVWACYAFIKVLPGKAKIETQQCNY